MPNVTSGRKRMRLSRSICSLRISGARPRERHRLGRDHEAVCPLDLKAGWEHRSVLEFVKPELGCESLRHFRNSRAALGLSSLGIIRNASRAASHVLDGRVRGIHAGFASSATGEASAELARETKSIIEHLLVEEPAT